MFGKQKLGGKLLVAFLIVGTVPFLLNGIMMMMKSKKALEAQSFSQLVSIREVKKERVGKFFADHQNNMAVLMDTVATLRQAALEKLQTAQGNKKAQLESFFQERLSNLKVLSKSAHVSDALTQYQDAFKGEEGQVGGFMYDLLDKQFEGSFKQFVKEYSYYDLYLIWKNGDVVYSLAKESDVGTNLVTGDLKESALGKCFQASLQKETLIDFKPYAPSNNQNCAFIGAPVITKENELIGCVVVQLLKDPINTIVGRRNGMGASSKTYLVTKGENGYVSRSDIADGAEKISFGQNVAYDFVSQAVSGESGQQVITDTNGMLRIVAYDPVHIEGLNWAMISDIQMEEAIAPKLTDKKYDYFGGYVEQYGYADLLLIHPQGDVFYSVKHYSDYQTNLVNGKFAESGLGTVFKTVLQTKQFGFSDFTAFEPYDNKPAAFIAQPVMQDNKVQLVVVVMFSPDEINAIMKEQTGMGSTGETYLIGTDGLMRSDCRNAEGFTMAASFAHPERKIDTQVGKLALNGKTGRMATRNYNHEAVLSAYTPLEVWGATKWALIAEIQTKEAFAPITNLIWIGIVVAVFGFILVIAGTVLLSRSIVAPIKSVVNGLTDMVNGKGDLTRRLAETQKDEIGDLSRVFNQFIVNLQAMIKSIAGNAQLLQTSSMELAELSHQMSGSASELSEKSNLVSAAANEMNTNIDSAAGAISEVTTNTNMVASAAEEMTATINQIAQNSEKAAHITRQTVEQTKVVSGRVKELGDATQNIGNVTETITEISEQTNLLALNATIEAARAGEAGKGFAVVANEIKELANQTAQATSDIKNRINAIQMSMTGTVADIGKILDTIQQVDEIVSSIAGAVEEQSSTSQEIAKNVIQVSEGINEVNANASQSSEVAGSIAGDMAMVNQAAMEISSNSAQVDGYVEKLSHLSEELNSLIRQFTV